MAFIEKRSFPRLSCKVEVQCRAISLPEGIGSLRAQSKDISAGGIGLITCDKFNLGTALVLMFSLPDTKEPICAMGKVMWTEEANTGTPGLTKAYDTGIEFISIQPEDQEKIKQYVIPRL